MTNINDTDDKISSNNSDAVIANNNDGPAIFGPEVGCWFLNVVMHREDVPWVPSAASTEIGE